MTFRPPASPCAGSSASGSAPATWCSGRLNSPPDFRLRRSGMAPQLVPLGEGVSVAGRLDRADIDALARAGVRTILNNRPDDEEPGQLPAAEAQQLAEAQGIA